MEKVETVYRILFPEKVFMGVDEALDEILENIERNEIVTQDFVDDLIDEYLEEIEDLEDACTQTTNELREAQETIKELRQVIKEQVHDRD